MAKQYHMVCFHRLIGLGDLKVILRVGSYFQLGCSTIKGFENEYDYLGSEK